MATQHRPLRPARTAKAIAAPAPGPTHRRVEQSLVGLFVLAVGLVIFRAMLIAADDAMLALLAPVVVFLLVASLFAGNDRRRL